MFKRFAFNWKAQTAHGLHSPFVFELYTQVIDPIYQQNPENIQEAMIHGIGKYLKLAAGKIQVVDFSKLRETDLEALNTLLDDPTNLLVCLNIRDSDESIQNWSFISAKPQSIHSIELFEMGIISLNPIAPKQHFYLKKS
ncbi:MAG: hypothetical protein RL567_1645 [Bacteroidota bacterium]|jgi:hypothetical protein